MLIEYLTVEQWQERTGCKTLYSLAQKLKVNQCSLRYLANSGVQIAVFNLDDKKLSPEVFSARKIKSTHE